MARVSESPRNDSPQSQSPSQPQTQPPLRRAGWMRIGVLLLLGAVCVAIGHWEIAPLFAAVAVVVWWTDRGIGAKPPERPGPPEG
jgi:hypothetical protein